MQKTAIFFFLKFPLEMKTSAKSKEKLKKHYALITVEEKNTHENIVEKLKLYIKLESFQSSTPQPLPENRISPKVEVGWMDKKSVR
jgi:hypothetical protein